MHAHDRLGSIWDQLGINLESLWDDVGITLWPKFVFSNRTTLRTSVMRFRWWISTSMHGLDAQLLPRPAPAPASGSLTNGWGVGGRGEGKKNTCFINRVLLIGVVVDLNIRCDNSEIALEQLGWCRA